MTCNHYVLMGQDLYNAIEWVADGYKTLTEDDKVIVNVTGGSSSSFALRFVIPVDPFIANKITVAVNIDNTEVEGTYPLTIIKNGSGYAYKYVPIKKGMHNLILRTFDGDSFENMRVQLENIPVNKEIVLQSVIVNVFGG